MSGRRLVVTSIRPVIPCLLALIAILAAGCQGINAAARDGNLKAVKQQLAWGANPNNVDWLTVDTPLIEASRNGHLDVVKLLVEKGADVNRKGEAWYGPLHVACSNQHVEIVKFLLANGADVNIYSHHKPLHYVAACGNIELAELLLANGADINAKGIDEATPLFVAVVHRHSRMVQWLLSKGADPNRAAIYDRTPLQAAAGRNDVTVARMLLAHGAKTTGIPAEFIKSCYNR